MQGELKSLFYYTLEDFCTRYKISEDWAREIVIRRDEILPSEFQIVISELDLMKLCGLEVMEIPLMGEDDPRKLVKVLI